VRNATQAEIKQRRSFKTLEEEAFVALLRTADVLQGCADEMFKQHGLSPTQYNVLRILRGAKTQGLPCGEIAERMINRDPDITRLLGRLERRGLVRRKRQQKDRRVIRACITAMGLGLLKDLDDPVVTLNRQMLGHLGKNRLQALISLLRRARERGGDSCRQSPVILKRDRLGNSVLQSKLQRQ
jgi:DNA-binding MarR family transcriptional regulator